MIPHSPTENRQETYINRQQKDIFPGEISLRYVVSCSTKYDLSVLFYGINLSYRAIFNLVVLSVGKSSPKEDYCWKEDH